MFSWAPGAVGCQLPGAQLKSDGPFFPNIDDGLMRVKNLDLQSEVLFILRLQPSPGVGGEGQCEQAGSEVDSSMPDSP